MDSKRILYPLIFMILSPLLFQGCSGSSVEAESGIKLAEIDDLGTIQEEEEEEEEEEEITDIVSTTVDIIELSDITETSPEDSESQLDVFTPGTFGDPCTANSECESGFCVEGYQGYVCTEECIEDCPEGYDCKVLNNSQTDQVSVCIARISKLCRECQPETASLDCNQALCIAIGGGTYCTTDCDEGECPGGYSCELVEDTELSISQEVCLPINGSCDCLDMTAGQERACNIQNDFGTCNGVEICDAELGWIDCNAKVPEAEICNGIDDNCNGKADEDLPETQPCTVENDAGTCEGLQRCYGSAGWICDAGDPSEESCDFKDNDCDGATDENFKSEAKYATFEHCGACNLSCYEAIPNASTTTCDGSQEVPICVVDECEEGYFKTNPFLCLPEGDTLCQPCAVDAQCPGSACVPFDSGKFCATQCVNEDCPGGYACTALEMSDGSQQDYCIPANGSCTCTAESEGEQRPCENNGCYGLETCDPDQGWGACDAQAPSDEICDNIDNNCNGVIDEGLGGQPCEVTNEFGSCEGSTACLGESGTLCVGPSPIAEECDGIDNDCDKKVDEGFTEGGEYKLDEHCGGCNINCDALVANGTGICDSVSLSCQVDECDEGYYAFSGLLCLPLVKSFCEPCQEDAQCGGGLCREFADGQHCTYSCSDESPCPEGYSCTDQEDLASPICLPDNGTCDCSPLNAGEKRSCKTTNELGTCFGYQTCDPSEGWTLCDAPAAAAETCDGFDNDCNGLVDETFIEDGVPITKPCSRTNDNGTCWGESTCYGTAGWQCAAPEPAQDICNFKDDDCDAKIDEDFVNAEGAYATEQYCGSCYTSCAGGFPNAADVVCDATANPPECIVDQCEDGYYKFNKYQCIPETAGLCQSCITDDNCSAEGSRCIPLSDGDFCSKACTTVSDCPQGYACQDYEGSNYCIPETNSCGCDGSNLDLAQNCEIVYTAPGTDQVSTCFGIERCKEDGWGGCEVPEETCNGLDDNCDGNIDESFRNADGVYDTNAHCGACDNNCSALAVENSGPYCDSTSAAAPFCTYQCNTGFFDADMNSNNGCECEFKNAVDVPDDSYDALYEPQDSNCDGIDGEIENAIFVAKNGNDSENDGSIESPLLTIQAAISKALTSNRRDVLVATGVYSENIVLAQGVSVYGGYSSNFRTRNTLVNETVILGATTTENKPGAVNAFNISGAETTIAGFTIFGKNNKTFSGSSYAVYVQDCDDALTIRTNRIVSGDGGKGLRGNDGSAGSSGSPASPGTNAKDINTPYCSSFNTTNGGPGGSKSCLGVNVSGGQGGMSRCPSYLPIDSSGDENGQTGSNNAGSYGQGGTKGYDMSINGLESCSQCYYPPNSLTPTATNGTDGYDAPPATGGVGASDAEGSLSATSLWVGGNGGNGVDGVHGGGGGGGGAGSGVRVEYCNMVGDYDDLGGTGGGGGSGGCGGTGGSGGTSGGGSFGIFITWTDSPSTVPSIQENVVEPAFGGDGGDGGNGGTGGLGGDGKFGGAGGANGSESWCARPGGKGGQGGDGAHGGGGGGGTGGVSYGIYLANPGNLCLSEYLDENTFGTTGAGGSGGSGGASLGNAGTNGATGNYGSTNLDNINPNPCAGN